MQKLNRIRFVAVLALLAFCITAFGFDGVVKRIKFARGKHSATVSNSVVRGDRDTYILGARGEQMMTVKITSLEDNAVFQVQGPAGDFLQDAGEEDEAKIVTISLPETGDYRIVVAGTRGNATYRLTVSVE
ncbi:MAG: hypothetical protein ACRD6X_13410 [Pyrinomonadaceae bacterium]